MTKSAVAERLSTARLDLRPPQAGDGLMFFSAVSGSLPDLRRFLAGLPWVALEPSIDAAEQHCAAAHGKFLAREDLPYLLFERASGDMVGAVGLHRPDWSVPKFEVGYWCRSDRQGRGYISEAVRCVVAHAFNDLAAARVELVVDEDNQASRRVALRCGFELEGVHRHDRRAADGRLASTCVYARVAAAGLPPGLSVG